MMGPEEILVEFRGAKDKKAQIEILGDLNAVAPREIAKIIDAAGELAPAGLTVDAFAERYEPVSPASAPQNKTGRPTKKPFDEARALALFEEGLTDEAIADQLGVKVYCIQIWRRQNGLRRDFSWRKYYTSLGGDDGMQDKPSQVENAGNTTAIEPPHIVTAEPPLTLARLWAALNRMMTPDLLNAELRINGRADVDVRGYEVNVANNRVYVDLYLRGQEGA